MEKKIFRTLSLATAVLLLLGLGITGREAHAQDSWLIFVTTTEDLRDFELNSNCSAGQPMGGFCSLRAAIYEASHFTLEPVKIMLPPGEYKLTRAEPGYEGEEEAHYGDLDFPDLADDKSTYIRIIGTGGRNPSVIDANFIDRVMEIGKNQRVSLENLVLKNGLAISDEDQPTYYGGGLKVYEASVELYNVRLTNNKAQGQLGPYPSYGGGIYSEKSYLRLEDCELDHNTSDASSAIHMKDNNWSTDILSSTIHHNIVSKYETFAGHIHLENELVMTNSTMSDNQGGDFNIVVNDAPALIQHSTLISSGELGSIDSQSGNLELWFNILQVIPIPGDNQGIVCSVPFIARPSLGGNIFSDDTCTPGANDAVYPYSDMFLGPLGNYGGITPTIPLRPGSPAVNYKVFDCTNAYGSRLWVDQREKSRNDHRCDPGSFELQAGENPTVVYLPLIAK